MKIEQAIGGPTMTQYAEFDKAFDWFNDRLFDGALPKVLVTFSRKPRMLGYFSAERWESASDTADRAAELSFNPDYFANPKSRTLTDVLATLAHEMAHCWQHSFGKPSRSGYHNRQWGQRMEAIGLMPSNTGAEGGAKTGQQMDHYILDGGPFALAAADLLAAGWAIKYLDRAERFTAGPAAPGSPVKGPDGKGLAKAPAKPKAPTRTKFACPECKAAAWGKPTLKLVCGDCGQPMAATS